MPNGTYGGVRGRKTKVGRKLLRFPPTRSGKEEPALLPSPAARYVHRSGDVSRVACERASRLGTTLPDVKKCFPCMGSHFLWVKNAFPIWEVISWR